MRCVVTGGCGFIGSHVVDALVARGDSVTVLDDLSSGTIHNLNGQAQLVNGSILDTSRRGQLGAGSRLCFPLVGVGAGSPFNRRPGWHTPSQCDWNLECSGSDAPARGAQACLRLVVKCVRQPIDPPAARGHDTRSPVALRAAKTDR